jgi:hypothetical protein
MFLPSLSILCVSASLREVISVPAAGRAGFIGVHLRLHFSLCPWNSICAEETWIPDQVGHDIRELRPQELISENLEIAALRSQ